MPALLIALFVVINLNRVMNGYLRRMTLQFYAITLTVSSLCFFLVHIYAFHTWF